MLKKIKSSIYQYWILILIPLLIVIVLRLFGFDGLYGQDSYEYLRYTSAIRKCFFDGTHPGSYYWPVLYPFLGSILSFILGNTIFALQFITAISLSFSCIYLIKIIRLLYPDQKRSFLYILIFGMFSPFFLKMGMVIMSDLMAATFLVITFYYFFKAYYKGTNIAFVFIFATCAVMTRYASLFIILPVIIYSFFILIKRKAIKNFMIAIFFSSIVTIPFLFFQKDDLFYASSNYFFNSWSLLNYFKSNFKTIDGMGSYPFPNLIHSLYIFIHPGYIYIGMLLSLLFIKNFKLLIGFQQKIIISSILLYLIFLSGIPFQNTRVLGLLFPIVLLFFYPAFSYLINFAFIKKYLVALGVISFVLQIFFWVFTFQHTYKRTILERKMVEILTPYQGGKLHSFDLDIALEGRGLDFEYKNLYSNKEKKFKTNDFVLFHPTKFLKQWSDTNLINNWNYLHKNYQLEVIKNASEGWILYQIKTK